jgi:hypothetical protein
MSTMKIADDNGLSNVIYAGTITEREAMGRATSFNQQMDQPLKPTYSKPKLPKPKLPTGDGNGGSGGSGGGSATGTKLASNSGSNVSTASRTGTAQRPVQSAPQRKYSSDVVFPWTAAKNTGTANIPETITKAVAFMNETQGSNFVYDKKSGSIKQNGRFMSAEEVKVLNGIIKAEYANGYKLPEPVEAEAAGSVLGSLQEGVEILPGMSNDDGNLREQNLVGQSKKDEMTVSIDHENGRPEDKENQGIGAQLSELAKQMKDGDVGVESIKELTSENADSKRQNEFGTLPGKSGEVPSGITSPEAIAARKAAIESRLQRLTADRVALNGGAASVVKDGNKLVPPPIAGNVADSGLPRQQ